MSEKCRRAADGPVYSHDMSTTAAPAYVRRVDSPIGRLEITSDGSAITSLTIERAGHLPWEQIPEKSTKLLDTAARQLGEYFAGKRRNFDVPVSLPGTEFQQAVWAELVEIPYGGAVSYGSLGLATGRTTAGRAVGGAVGANPIPIIIPCHRVLASDGRITGYSGGNGIPTKVWLLKHEGIAHR
jgi:methylated-DNA-[protein]-cysteine S-methyltransferase